MQAARAYVQNDSTSQIGGFGPYPSERVPALEHYRLVSMSEFSGLQGRLGSVFSRDAQASGFLGNLRLPANASRQQVTNAAVNALYPNTPSWVKVFERVPGATIEGTGPANTTVSLSVQLNPADGRAFTYRQQVQTDDSGAFTATVPYASTGYDAVGLDDGYGNTSVRATSPYQIQTTPTINGTTVTSYTGTVNVTERQVLGVNESAATVDLEEQTRDFGQDDNSTDGSGTDGNTSDGSTADGNTSDGTTNNGAETNTSNSLVGIDAVPEAPRVTP
jgi:dolichyl-diphosphooligosaccharide--protein glycosyltransferase